LDQNKTPGSQDPKKRSNLIQTIIWIILPLLLVVSMYFTFNSSSTKDSKKYYEVISYFQQGEVTEYTLNISTGKLSYTLEGETEARTYNVPSVDLFVNDTHDSIMEYNEKHPDSPIKVDYQVTKSTSWLSQLLPVILSTVLIIVVCIWIMRRMNTTMMNENNRALGFGKARIKKGDEVSEKKTFADVAGADEEKEELKEIVDFLKDPHKYDALGARIPKGVLLVGPPGTGKTLLARATAGEADRPFFSISGSDFVEMYVGVGASRVRDLFDNAKKNAPAIIFIDEIDAVGRHRGAGMGGGHDEREQTLNQLLVEMDGFAGNLGIVVIAATNRPDILDPALLRPGRFDRQITVNYPDVVGREAILKIHAKNKPIAPDVDLNVIANATAGFTGADLENLLNESALLAARKGRKAITAADVGEATVKVMVGPEKKTKKMSDQEKKLTAYHEAGHAVTNFYLPLLDPVHEISIIPRGSAGGYTMSVPTEDKSYMTKNTMLQNLVSLLGGRVAEALIMGDVSTGASNDIERATKITHNMITRYGMSEKLGTISYGSDSDEVFLGMDYGRKRDYSEATAAAIDQESKRIMDHAYQEAERLLKEHSDKLDNVAKFLIQYEKMDGTIFRQIMESNNFDIDAFIQEHGEKLKRHTMTPAEMIQAAKDAKAAKEAQVQKADMDANTEGTH
jgi:cell division protease FtsH